MAIVGPLTSIVLAALFLGIAFAPGVRDGRIAVMWEWLFLMNLALGVVNLAPGFPLDGGRVLRAALWGATGNYRQATRWASLCGRALGFGLMALGMLTLLRVMPWFDAFSGVWFFFVGLFLDSAARQSWQHTQMLETLGEHRVASVMRTSLPSISQDATLLEAVGRHFDVHYGLCAFAIDDADRVTGMLSTPQLTSTPKERWAETSVASVMLPVGRVPVITADATLATAIEQLESTEQTHLAVLEAGRLIGYVARGRILALLAAESAAAA
jgi:predicted transcriptional regulator